MSHQQAYKQAMLLASHSQYVQPTKDGMLILDRAVTDLGWKTYRYVDKFVSLDLTIKSYHDD
jgi:hypothetical protein